VVFPIPAFTDGEREAQAERLTATEWAQPALAAHGLALLEVLQALGLRPDCVAGHSFGELTALCAAGAYDSAALLRLARRRGELMGEAVGTAGAMLAVLADAGVVQDALAGAEDLWLANHNGPGEFVVSGTREAIAALRDRLVADRVSVRELSTATAFHSPLVAPAGPPLAEHLAGVEVRPPAVDVYGNADAAPYPPDPDQVRGRIASHPETPVCWADTIEAMYAAGARTFVEVGAGGTLTALMPRILGEAEHTAIRTDGSGLHGVTGLHRALGQLAARGVPMTFEPLWENHRPVAEPAADQAGKRSKVITKITGRNLGRTYPPAGGAAALPPPNPEPPPEPGSAASASPSIVDNQWLRMIQQAQTETAEAHGAYQRAMAETHTAYLKQAETSMETLAAMVNGGALPPLPETGPMERAGVQAAGSALVPTSASDNGSRYGMGNVSGELPDLTAIDVEDLVVSIVADKTGYPPAMITMDMDIETDLGIDSIKRVEIMASLRTEVPWLPEVTEATAAELAEAMSIRTVGEVVDRTRTELAAVSADPSALRARLANGPAANSLSMEDLTVLARTVNVPSRVAPDGPGTSAIGAIPVQDRRSEPAGRTPPGLVRMAVRARPTVAPGVAMAGLWEAPLVVTDDGNGLAELVTRRLVDAGVAARVVSDVPAHPGGVLFLGGLREVASVDEATSVQRAAFHAARTVAPGLAADGGLFVTVQDTGGDFGLRGAEPDRVWLGGLAALARTVAREWPRASVKAIDCERAGRDGAAIAAAVVDELCSGGAAPEVGLRADGTRLGFDCVTAPGGPAGEVTFGPDPVIVVSGGARGVTATAVQALARSHHPRLVLLGRTPLAEEPDWYADATDEASLTRLLAGRIPDATPARLRAHARTALAAREARRTLAQLEDAGVTVRYRTVDVTDSIAVDRALAEVRRDWGPITGLVHGAGVLADKSIAEKTDESFDAVFDTKVTGLHALLAATAGDPLRLLCVFSSVVARFGNAGQCDYAMANETLNQVLCAEAVRRPDCAVRSLLWGPWRGGMVTDVHADLARRTGVVLIEPSTGADAFTAELAAASTDTQVVLSTPEALEALAGPATRVSSVATNGSDHAAIGQPTATLVHASPR
jgi:malonyl CoA-acyl carrier protein transacylase/acyl carrier protein